MIIKFIISVSNPVNSSNSDKPTLLASQLLPFSYYSEDHSQLIQTLPFSA
jgi:hypothetical protein